MDLKGKVAIITGGGTGIGEAIARRFVADGARVCITGRRREMLEKVAESLPSDKIKTCPADVSDPNDVERMVETALSFSGGLHVLVNNAAMSHRPASIVDLDPAIWTKTLEINLTGPFLTMKASLPHMIKTGGGSIINISSLAGIRCIPGKPAYCASKAGLIHLTFQAALDYGRFRIRCNAVCPAAVESDMFTSNMQIFANMLGTGIEDIFSRFSNDVPLHRTAVPEEVAGLCSYLASDDSSFTTGVVIPVDGGASIVDVSGAAMNRIVQSVEAAGGKKKE
ncbi:MAG TPA: SDR family oxidoreductase [Syntrophorhabdaceae bacterium]|nr:SDR family oxidoreductase [Syntrophorhabdaceae bacterium]